MRDVLLRLDGVGNVNIFGARDYSMRVWLDPAKVANVGLTANEVVLALRAANLQVAAGSINQPPAMSPGGFELSVQTLGRLTSPDQFEDIVVKAGDDGSVVRVRDIARVELGSQDYTVNAYLNNKIATALVIFQRPGSNALATAKAIRAAMDGLAKDFPPGVAYSVVYNPTDFIQSSVDAVVETLFEAVLLVVVVVILFLQTWRAAIIPIVAIPVSLIGTFAVMAAVGILLQHAVAVRTCAGHRHRRGRCNRRRRERRALFAPGHVPARGRTQDHGRGRQRAGRHLPGAHRSVPADGIHRGAAGIVLSPVRHHHRRRNGNLCDRLPDAIARARGAPFEAARRACGGEERRSVHPHGTRAVVLCRVQLGI